MSRSTLERLAPLTGIVFVALLVISFIVGGEAPDADESTEEVVAFWTEDDSAQIASAIIGAWAAVFLVWFGGTVAAAGTACGGRARSTRLDRLWRLSADRARRFVLLRLSVRGGGDRR